MQINGSEVSSSRIRVMLLQGDVRAATDLLGRPYRLSGVVGTGQRRGQTIGFPTANLDALATLIPGDGVYAVRALVGDTIWSAAANVGPNPTFGEDARKVEVHLIGFRGDLYGTPLAVDFVERLRDTRPFRGAAELIEQLKKDVEQARGILATYSGRKIMAEPDDCTNLEQRIQHIVTEEIAPMLQMDGGGIEVISIQDGVVQVRLLGTCAGCPSTVRAIIMGIEGRTAQAGTYRKSTTWKRFREGDKAWAFSSLMRTRGRSSQRRLPMVECVLAGSEHCVTCRV